MLEEALDANPGERRIHYALARLLMDTGEGEEDTVLYHLQRSFSPGDRNYDAQLRYGRELFRYGRLDESKEVFKGLGRSRVPENFRNRLRYDLDEIYYGRVVRIEVSYCFVKRETYGDWIYCHFRNNREVWNKLTVNLRVKFTIAFTFRGANGHSLELI